MEILSMLVFLSGSILITLAYVIGEYVGQDRGRSSHWRDRFICNGNHPRLEKTGWDENSCRDGRGKYYCSRCKSSFTEDGKRIPNFIDNMLFLKEMAEDSYLLNNQDIKEEWDVAKGFLKRIFE